MHTVLPSYINYLSLERHFSPLTVRAYEKDVQTFLDYCLAIDSQMQWEMVDYSCIRQWISVLSEEGMSHRSINRKMSALKSFFKFLVITQVIEHYPFLGHKSLRVEKKLQVPFSESEMNALQEQHFDEDFEGVRDRLIIEMLYTLGIRRAELLNIKVSSIDFYSQTLRVMGKRNKERVIPMIGELVALLQKYLKIRQELFPNAGDVLMLLKNGNNLNETFVYRLINSYFRGITSKEKKSPHMLRHTFATHLLNRGADLNSIKELMGHSSLSSTQVYTHSSLEQLKQVHLKAHPRNNNDEE